MSIASVERSVRQISCSSVGYSAVRNIYADYVLAMRRVSFSHRAIRTSNFQDRLIPDRRKRFSLNSSINGAVAQ